MQCHWYYIRELTTTWSILHFFVAVPDIGFLQPNTSLKSSIFLDYVGKSKILEHQAAKRAINMFRVVLIRTKEVSVISLTSPVQGGGGLVMHPHEFFF